LALQLADFPGNEQPARKFLARACIQTGQAETAASAAKAAVDHDRSDHEAWYLLARAHAGQNQWRFAVNEIRKAVSLVNPLPEPYRQLRDFVYEQRVNGMSLKVRLKKIAAGECPVCSAVGAFKNNVCAECGYKSEVDGIAQGVKSYLKEAWDNSTSEAGKPGWTPAASSPTRAANACPVCGFSYGYRDGVCEHCRGQSPSRSTSEHRTERTNPTSTPSHDSPAPEGDPPGCVIPLFVAGGLVGGIGIDFMFTGNFRLGIAAVVGMFVGAVAAWLQLITSRR
jgi:hypothetical protein